MSFGAEFKNMRNQGGAPKMTEDAVKSAEADIAAKVSAVVPTEDPDAAILAQPFVDGQEYSPAPVEEPPVIPAPRQEKKMAIKIGGKTFDNEQDALNYANDLELSRIQEEAYQQGQKSTTPAPEKPVEIKKIKKIADKLFEDPEAAMQELEDYILEMADKRVENRESKKSEETLRAEQIKKDTDEFYKNNADLADWQDEVNVVVQRNWAALSKLPKEQIMVEAAKLSRDYVASVKEKALPRQSLPSKTAVTSQGTQRTTTATSQPATEKKVSFASQVRSTNRRTVLQDEA